MAAGPRTPSNGNRAGGEEPRLELKDEDFPALPPAPASPAASPPASTTVAGSPGRKDGAYAKDSSSEGGGPWARQPSNSSSNRPARKKSHLHGHPGRHGKRSTAAVAKRGVRGRGSPGSSVGFGDDLDERSSSSDDEDSEEDERQRGWRIRLAPWNTPLHRRLQTAVVLLHCLGMGLTFSFFCFLCTMPLLWPVLVAYYFVYVYLSQAGTDGRTGRRVDWLRRSRLWVHFANYFPARLHKTADLPPTRKYIFAVHPHGIISHGAWAAFATEALGFSAKFPGVTNSLLTLNGNFKTPFYREYLLAMGLLSVSKESITNALTRGGVDGEGMGNAVSIVVGGAREALEGQPRTMRLIIERRGFCRMAIRTGADLVPVLAFGENDLYAQWGPRDHPWFHSMQKKALALLGFSVPVLQGRGVFNYDFGILPHRRPLNVVVGAPIKVRQEGRGADDLERETENLHRIYVQSLEDLYHRYKDVYFKNRKEELVFVDRK
ncbi:hypothetical protein RB597_004561 [Gaeumannomyces tritici]